MSQYPELPKLQMGKWVDDSTDPKVREAAKAYSAAELVLTTRQANSLR
jgi:hypothetical protein